MLKPQTFYHFVTNRVLSFISKAERFKLKLAQLQKEFQLEIEESDTKHAPNEFVKNDDKNVVQLTFIIFFDKPFGSMFSTRFYHC